MEDPGKLMEDGMAQTAEVLALKASVKEGQRLLRQALKERNVAKNQASYLQEQLNFFLSNLVWIQRCWAFHFLPRDLRNSIQRNAPVLKVQP